MPNSSDREVYALFVDMMGSADLLESLSLRDANFLGWALQNKTNILAGSATRLLQRYRTFHSFLSTRGGLGSSHVISVIGFSDSAYMIFDQYSTAEVTADVMMNHFLRNDVPVRMGIGKGTFARLPFETSSDPEGLVLTTAPFLGTSVIRAYRAQACKCRGFRIFLHPSVSSSLDEKRWWLYDELSPEEKSIHCERTLNFVGSMKEGEELTEAVKKMGEGVVHAGALQHYRETEGTLYCYSQDAVYRSLYDDE